MPEGDTPGEPDTQAAPEMPEELRDSLEKIVGLSEGLGDEVPAGPVPQPVAMGEVGEMAEAISRPGVNDPAGHASMANIMREQMKKRGMVMVDEAADKGAVKGKGTQKLETFFVDPKVVALDLADEEQRKEYEGVMLLLADPTSGYVPYGHEQGPDIIENPKSDRGYSIIVVLRYAKVSKKIVDYSPQYDVIKPDQIRAEFQNNGGSSPKAQGAAAGLAHPAEAPEPYPPYEIGTDEADEWLEGFRNALEARQPQEPGDEPEEPQD